MEMTEGLMFCYLVKYFIAHMNCNGRYAAMILSDASKECMDELNKYGVLSLYDAKRIVRRHSDWYMVQYDLWSWGYLSDTKFGFMSHID